jgi:plastocyanin
VNRTKIAIAALATGGVLAAGASAAPAPTLTIRHQEVGCHSWSLNNGPYKVVQSLTLTRGTVLTVTDNDVMAHTLIETKGPKLAITKAKMSKPGAQARIAFTKPGSYVFGTLRGSDYVPVKTIGPDNNLHLNVVVR